jgi:hypothetical protein
MTLTELNRTSYGLRALELSDGGNSFQLVACLRFIFSFLNSFLFYISSFKDYTREWDAVRSAK